MPLTPVIQPSTRPLPRIDDSEVSRLRRDFPALDTEVHGRRLIYLDSGATSQNPWSVIDAERQFYEQRNAAVHRGAHHLAVEATEAFENARQTVADFVGADYEETVWVSNATEGLNAISYAFSNATLWATNGRPPIGPVRARAWRRYRRDGDGTPR
jgi:cysteine desulfurase/selenocysteine lyase